LREISYAWFDIQIFFKLQIRRIIITPLLSILTGYIYTYCTFELQSDTIRVSE